jgi:phage terminase large subunit-like protein
LIFPKNNSLLKPLAAKAATIEGTNPSLAIVDEYHLHPDNGVYSALELGMGARPEAVLFAITTAGSNVVLPASSIMTTAVRFCRGREQRFAVCSDLRAGRRKRG